MSAHKDQARGSELTLEQAGHDDTRKLFVGTCVSRCGGIEDGVSIRHPGDGGFVIPFADLERWYLAAKAEREK